MQHRNVLAGTARHLVSKTKAERTAQEEAELGAFLSTWLSPRELAQHFNADLDPACPPNMPWRTAKVMLTPAENGLTTPWRKGAFVFMNPPYNRQEDKSSIKDWMAKLAEHGNGVALVFANSDTRWFHDYVFNHPNCTGVLWIKSRVKFANLAGETLLQKKPSVLVAYGNEALARIRDGLERGVFHGSLQSVVSRAGRRAA